jgi:hypothetical protein
MPQSNGRSKPSSACSSETYTKLPPNGFSLTGFWVPLHSPICSLSLLFSTNKIFPTSAVGVHLCFHPQSRLKNPEHLKFLHVSSVHHHLGVVKRTPTSTVPTDGSTASGARFGKEELLAQRKYCLSPVDQDHSALHSNSCQKTKV